MLAEGITLPEQIDPPGASAIRRTGLIYSAPVRLNPVYARAVAPLLPQPSAELAAGLSWQRSGPGRPPPPSTSMSWSTTAPPILWTRACRPQPARGSLVADQRRDRPSGYRKLGPSLGLLLRCGCGQQLGYAERAGRSDSPWPVASLAGARVSSVPGRALHVPQLPSRPLAQTALGWRAAATRLRSGGDDTFDGRVARCEHHS
jgi:hypothetical protein